MEAIVFIGIQGPGKSTYYREHFFHSHVRISLDLLRTRHRERLFLETCLKTQQRFVIDNTNPKRQERAMYISAAKAARYGVVGYYFEVDLETALARNNSRPASQVIPAKGVAATLRKLERPTLDEGFRHLYTLRPDESGHWVVFSHQEAPETQPSTTLSATPRPDQRGPVPPDSTPSLPQ